MTTGQGVFEIFYINHQNPQLHDTGSSARKIPYDTVVAANFADSKCEASEKSDSFALSVSYKCLVLY